MSRAKLETASNWLLVMIPTELPSVQVEQGLVVVSKSMMAHEIERLYSVRPAHLKLYGEIISEAPHRT